MGLPARDEARHWVGRTVVDREGTPLGVCRAVLADEATGLPEWVSVEVDGVGAVVPVVDATEDGDRVRVTVSRAEVVGAPTAGDAGRLSEAEEQQLYRHYGIEYSREASESLLPAGTTGAPGAGSPSGTGAAARGRVRRVVAPIVALAGAAAVAATVARRGRTRRPAPPTRTGRLRARWPWAPQPPSRAERVRAAAALAASRVRAR